MTAQSIPELTNYEYSELSYNSAAPIITGSFVNDICDLLNKCGVSVNYTNSYDSTLESAVRKFQSSIGISPTGILTTATLQSMLLYKNKINDIVEDDGLNIKTQNSMVDSAHQASFFADDNFKTHRRNHKDIKIVFGEKSITKTIKDVFMRSVSLEVDTSGNPVSEIYEFIARDITETDEINDINKYGPDNKDYASSDIKYNFKSIKGGT